MRPICKLYLWMCQRYRRNGLSLSAHAWVVFRKTGSTFWRDRLDGLALLILSDRDHCQSCHRRETAIKDARP